MTASSQNPSPIEHPKGWALAEKILVRVEEYNRHRLEAAIEHNADKMAKEGYLCAVDVIKMCCEAVEG